MRLGIRGAQKRGEIVQWCRSHYRAVRIIESYECFAFVSLCCLLLFVFCFFCFRFRFRFLLSFVLYCFFYSI